MRSSRRCLTRPAAPSPKAQRSNICSPSRSRYRLASRARSALHFRIAPGLHINSHTPKDSYLIPTVFAIPAGTGVALKDAHYPEGNDITLPLDPQAKLNVYSGEFIIDTHIVAGRGNHLVQATLRYQACDNNACMPPKTVTVPIDVIGN